jgi:spore maturation protein CgeB
MRFLVVGAWRWSWYQQAFAEALIFLGHEVQGFGWAKLFLDGQDELARPRNLWARGQDRAIWGPLVNHLNRQLEAEALRYEPDVLFAYNATHVLPATLKRIKRVLPRTLLVQYANDNPFSPRADRLLWRHLKHAVPLYDAHFVYRHSNREDFRRRGAGPIYLLRSYYLPATDFRRELSGSDARFMSDVSYVGHYEYDGRLELLEAVAQLDAEFKLFGSTWHLAKRHLKPDSPLHRFFPVQPLFKADYRKAISGTKIALNFLSKLNADTYTRRNFEIPAMKTFMLSEYSDDLASLYREGKEVEFFRSKGELLEKVTYYLKHHEQREAIAHCGHQRLLRDGHDVVSRAKQFVSIIETLR